MKRFWKAVAVEPHGGTWGISLDGRQVRTPAKTELALPSAELAQAIADEWDSVGEKIDPRSMPLTGHANAAIDRVAADKKAFAEGVARYAESDLLFYRAEGPNPLIERQEQAWDPLLSWARRRYDVDFETTSGLIHVAQPAATVDRLAHEVALLDGFHLAGLSPLVTISGSLIAGLAVAEEAVSAEAAWDAVTVDERWQMEQWGSDAEAELALANRKADFLAAARFLKLL